MDIITAKLGAKMAQNELAKNGQIGSIEKNDGIVWDGNTTGKYIVEEVFALVSTVPMDLTSVESVTINNDVTYDNSVLTVVELDENTSMLTTGQPCVISVTKNYFVEGTEYKTGTYLYFNENAEYVSKVETKETIHTIDPKYLPGAVLPVVELTTDFSAVGAEPVALTESENQMLSEVHNARSMFTLSIVYAGMEFCCVPLRQTMAGIGGGLYSIVLTGAIIQITSEDGNTWFAMTVSA